MALKDLFALAGTITVDSSGAIKNIDNATKHAQDSESKFEKSFRTIKNLAITYLSGTAIWNFGKSMVEAAANVQAETAQFDAAFKDLSGSASEAFARLEESTGTLATRLQVTGTKAFSQFKGAGLDSAESLETMERYLKLATDGAAYYDLTLEETDELLRSFIRGNTEAGDRLGLFTSETQRNTAAQEKYGKKFIELTEAQKQLLMLDISEKIYKDSGAIGQASRESDSYANVVGNLKEQWRQFLAQAGAPILQALIPILQSLGSVLQSLAPIFTTLTNFLVQNKELIGAIAIGLAAAAAAYGAYKLVLMAVNTYEKISNALKVAGALYSAAKTSATLAEAKATATATLAQKGLNMAMLGSPITWIILGITALVAAFVLLWKKCEGFRNFWKNVWDNIKNVAKTAWENIKKVWTAVKPFFDAIWKGIKAGAQMVWNALKVGFQVAWAAIKAVWNTAKSFFQMIWNTIKNIFSVVKNVLTGNFKGAWEGIKNIFKGVGTFFKNIVSNIVNAFKGIGKKIWDNFTGVFSRIWDGIKSIGSNIWGGVKSLFGAADGLVATRETAIRIAEYPNATTNPEIVTPQNIMADTFAETLDNYAFKTGGSGDNSRVISLLEEYLPALAQMKMVLSTGEIVGALTPRIDKALGDRSDKKLRGRV